MPLGVLSNGAADWLDVPVSVDLDQIYGPAPEDVIPWPGGNLVHSLALSGTVPGRLRRWGRATDGRWVGLVDFTVRDLHGSAACRMQRVVVPAEALSAWRCRSGDTFGSERRQADTDWASPAEMASVSNVTGWPCLAASMTARAGHGRRDKSDEELAEEGDPASRDLVAVDRENRRRGALEQLYSRRRERRSGRRQDHANCLGHSMVGDDRGTARFDSRDEKPTSTTSLV